MNRFDGRTAVVTGAASGIGLAIAKRCGREHMRLIIADIEEPALARAATELKAAGAEVEPVVTDVSDYNSIANLADFAYNRFGAVDLLVNNAGVGAAGRVWEHSLADWNWVLGVNLYGVIHGIKAFVPRMIDQNSDCAVVNIASIAGIITGPGMSIYNAAKHAVVATSETLYYDLEEAGAQVQVAVVCPAWVKTRIMESARNRPEEYPVESQPDSLPPWLEARREAIEGGIAPDTVADALFEGLNSNRFYIYTHPEAMALVQARMAGILDGTRPINPVVDALKLTQNAGGSGKAKS